MPRNWRSVLELNKNGPTAEDEARGTVRVNFEAEIRRLRDAIVSARWRLAKGKGLWNGPATECDMVLEDALKMHDPAEAIASMTCDHDWEQVNPRIFDGQRCLRCGTWK